MNQENCQQKGERLSYHFLFLFLLLTLSSFLLSVAFPMLLGKKTVSLSLAGYLQENAFFLVVWRQRLASLKLVPWILVLLEPYLQSLLKQKKSRHLIAVSSFDLVHLLGSIFQGCRHLDLRFCCGLPRSWFWKMEQPWYISLEGRLNSKQSL